MSATDATPSIMARVAKIATNAPRVVKDQKAKAEGKFAGYNYADINSILEMLKPILAAESLAIMQPIALVDGHMMVRTLIVDTETGESVEFDGAACPVKGDPQALGSAITYFRRYGIVSLFGLEAADDDGATAHRQATSPTKRTTAETEIREIIKRMDRSLIEDYKTDFKTEFGCGLTDLPESRHGDALGWTKFWLSPDDSTPTETETDEGGY